MQSPGSPSTAASLSPDLLEDIEIRVDEGRIHATTRGPSEHSGTLDLPLEAVRDALECLESPRASIPLLVATGAALYEALFPGDIRIALRESLERCRQARGVVRVRLSFVQEALEALPWELLYDPVTERWLGVDPHLMLVRHPPRPLCPIGGFRPPLRLLIVTAEPRDLPPLSPDLEQEVGDIEAALEDEVSGGRALLTRIRNPTPDALEEALLRHSYHIIHLIAHGRWNESRSRGELALCDAHGNEARVGENRLSTLMGRQRDLHLGVLNTCYSAKGDPGRGLARGLGWFELSRGQGLARALVSAGLPAVIGMQHRVENQVAVRFARKFYRALADGRQVDDAMQFARGHLLAQMLDQEEDQSGLLYFASPVLFMRTPRGEVFRLVDEPQADASERSQV